MMSYDELKAEMEVIQQQMAETMNNAEVQELANRSTPEVKLKIYDNYQGMTFLKPLKERIMLVLS